MHTLPLLTQQFAELSPFFYSRVSPEPLTAPYWVAFNTDLAAELNLDTDFQTTANLAYLSGNAPQYAPAPIAGVYSGHQFGVYTPRLGDGRALLIGDSIDTAGQRQEWQLKGAGKTPYSRFADGRAVLRSSIREYLCSEAMHGLGIPTTRALALCGSNDPVYRETVETAAVLTRIAPSFLRFGHFEYFYYTGREAEIQQLADYLIRHYYPDCRDADNPYAALLEQIRNRTADTVAAWQSVGFCHGVMNTDNMSALGLTIDYGPFGFLDDYDRRHVCNHSDTQGRYAYNAQPFVAHWNFSALASCFDTLVPHDTLEQLIDGWTEVFQTTYLEKMRRKLGLQQADKRDDESLIADLFAALQDQKTDFTLFFRNLSEVSNTHGEPIPPKLEQTFKNGVPPAFIRWLGRYRQRLCAENSDPAERAIRMNLTNPLYILRNYLAEQAIAQARNGDYREIERLRRCLARPFDEQAEFADLAEPPPEGSIPVCVSCSS